MRDYDCNCFVIEKIRHNGRIWVYAEGTFRRRVHLVGNRLRNTTRGNHGNEVIAFKRLALSGGYRNR